MKKFNSLRVLLCVAFCLIVAGVAVSGMFAFAETLTNYSRYNYESITNYSYYTYRPTTTAPATTAAPTTADNSAELAALRKQYAQLDSEIAADERKLDQVQDNINSEEYKLKVLNGQISSIKSQINLLESEVGTLNYQISSTDASINQLNTDIDTLNTQIDETQVAIDDAKATMAGTEEQVLGRIRAAYIGGEASNLEMLFSSSDLATFFTRKELIERVTENDRDLIEELRIKSEALEQMEQSLGVQKETLVAKNEELGEKRVQLAENKAELDVALDAQVEKKQELNRKSAEIQEVISDLDEDSDAYKAQIAQKKKDREEIEKQIDEYVRQHGSSQGDEVPISYNNDGKMCWPVPYANTAITASYPAYSDGSRHSGIDIVVRDSSGANVSNGKDIVAAQGGKVIFAISDNGYNNSYGNYCMIDHGDGTVTLYAHCKRVIVTKGQVVQKGQKIAEIGLTGNTTGYHLHFEVRVKDKNGNVTRVNPLNYVSKP